MKFPVSARLHDQRVAVRALPRSQGSQFRSALRPWLDVPPRGCWAGTAMNVYSKFETELAVRPDDIDLYQHVHSTRYLDYVLAARFEQMERFYGMSMQAFAERGLGWFMNSATIHFKRPLGWGDRMVVRCWIDHFTDTGCRVAFEIEKLPVRKRVCDGQCDYTLVTLASGRATPLPEDVRAKYSI